MAPASARAFPGDPEAHELLRAAHEGSYRYPPDFGGFEADLTFSGPEGHATGTVRVSASRSVELTILANDTARDWLRRELGMMIGHCWHLPYEQADGANILELGDDEDDPLGVTIDVKQDQFGSAYRVLRGEISQVSRTTGNVRFSIQIQTRAATPDGRTLPAHFTVFYWDAGSGRLGRTDVYRDAYEAVDGVSLPLSRRIVSAVDAGITTREMVMSNHRLLKRLDAATNATDPLEYRAR